MLSRIVIASFCIAEAFPISELQVSEAQLQALTVGSEDLAGDLMLPQLKQFFQDPNNQISVDVGDIIINQNIPNTVVDDHCEHHIEAKNANAIGGISHTSYLKGGVSISWSALKVFMEAELDATLGIHTDVQVKIGTKLFKHCEEIASDTMHLDLDSTGKNGVGISVSASGAHVEKVDGGWFLVFNFHADVWGTVMSWNVDDIRVHHGCKVEVLGITLVSVCGFIADEVGKNVQKLLNQVEGVTAPNLLKKLEDKINTAIGSEVRIPLRLIDVALV